MENNEALVVERRVTVRIQDGLHARPAAQFVKRARLYEAELWVDHNGKLANAKSSVKLMLLAVKENTDIVLRAEGADAQIAIEDLAHFLETEEEESVLPSVSKATGTQCNANIDNVLGQDFHAHPTDALKGIGASVGVSIGAAFRYFPETLSSVPCHIPESLIAAEIERYSKAVDKAVEALVGSVTPAQKGTTISSVDNIAEALVEIARDADFDAAIRLRIAEGVDAVTAVLDAGKELASIFSALSDPYLRARAEDMLSVARAIALACQGLQDPLIANITPGAILIADELTAWDLARAPNAPIGGIVCTHGSYTAHAAIIARTRGIPAVFGIAGIEAVADGTIIGLDGARGEVFIAPQAETLDKLRQKAIGEAAEKQALASFRDVSPQTKDGTKVVVAANLGSVEEIAGAKAAGAMGIGLFRTELLFIEARRPLTEDEQVVAYESLLKAFPNHHVTIRTLDVGGDKPIPGIDIPKEENPFLGWRGLRYCLDRPALFKTQLRALLRTAIYGNLRVMLPMVSDLEEIHRTRALIETCREELKAEGFAHQVPPLGIMVETPAAALLAESLATKVSFFSIGTNDLTQYIMAADRMNPLVSNLNRPDHPAVMKAIKMVADAGRNAGIPVCMCGEAAARPDLIPIFLQFGLSELSMTPSAVLKAKEVISRL